MSANLIDEMTEREAKSLLNDIAAVFKIGGRANTASVIMGNVKNTLRRSRCLSGVESALTVTLKDHDGMEYDECPVSWGAEREEYEADFRALLNTRPAVTDGSVPREPTREMLIAGWGDLLANFSKATDRYKAMLSAAPTIPDGKFEYAGECAADIASADASANSVTKASPPIPDSKVMVDREDLQAARGWFHEANLGQMGPKDVDAIERIEALLQQQTEGEEA